MSMNAKLYKIAKQWHILEIKVSEIEKRLKIVALKGQLIDGCIQSSLSILGLRKHEDISSAVESKIHRVEGI